MGSISVRLRAGKEGKQNIYLHFNYGRKRQYRFATGLSLKDKKHWNADSNSVKNVKGEPDSQNINSKLSLLISKGNKLLSELEDSGSPIDNLILKKHLKKIKEKGSSSIRKKVPLLTEHYDWFNDHFSVHPRPKTQKPLAKSTLKPYKNTLRIIKDYEKQLGIKFTFEHITLEFHHDFISYLQKEGFTSNYIGTQIKNIKTIMHDAYERGLHTNVDYQKSGFTKPKEEVNHIYLNMKELTAIKNLKLKNRPKLDIARDLFIIASMTGLRVSDFNNLNTSNIEAHKGIRFLRVKTQKTGKIVLIPLHPFVEEILKKRNGEFPPSMPDQHINEALKSIARKAKLKDEVIIKKTIGGKQVETTYKKHELVTNHTARRSFCTNAYKADMPVVDIMAISGHTSEKVFYNYIKATSLERLEKISSHSFFN
ncbi:site-specific integrase [Gramella lutea]|uniref:Site-specific integrase n=1 Tax=Christiangramia lutea TaxID=1607951 RepID=A0A9X2A9J4_9FLAO|nr:site-specific integrase [Christiangramia lutea]MCH4821757.1 site-specific integrase [Christiangramia lutea]